MTSFVPRRFDSHAHVHGLKQDYVPVLDALRVEAVLNLSYSDFRSPEDLEAFEAGLRAGTEAYPGRFLYATSFSVTRAFEPGYADDVIAKLERDVDRYCAVAVKVWKDLGMMLRAPDGRYVFCDDPVFTPIFDYAAERGLVVYMHLADPIAAWLPLDPASPHYRYYRAHPEFHWHGQDGKPRHEEILAHRDALVARYPDTPFVAAHLASLEHDLGLVSAFLDAHPNAYVDTAARLGDLQRMPPDEVRAFFTRYADRILYGSDWDYDEASYPADPRDRAAAQAATVQGFEKAFAYFEQTLALPPQVLDRFYRGNAARLFARAATP